MPRSRPFAGLAVIALLVSGCGLKPPSVAPTADDYLQAMPLEGQSGTQPAGNGGQTAAPNTSTRNAMTATLVTNQGDITIAFYPESPRTVENFAALARQGFYDGVKFHRVIDGFMVQTGDPLSKDDDWSNDGTGGPGYSFPDEFNNHPLVKGSVAMANSGPDTNGSQFFIVTAQSTPWLDGKHTNFGYVASGMEVVEAIQRAETNENDHPLKDIVIERVVVQESS